MSSTLPINVSSVFGGLGTGTCTITSATAGIITVGVKATIPYISAGSSSANSDTMADSGAGGSGLQIVVNQDTGGGPVAKLTLSSPAPTQPQMAGKVTMSCSAGDVITVVMSSSTAVDQAPNAVKTIINIYQGE